MILNMSFYIGISIVLAIVSVVFIFVWRKITDSEMYIKVLEKKLTNLKKENNMYREVMDHKNAENVSFEMAEDIMKDVFDEPKCNKNKCEVKFAETTESEDIQVQEVISDEEVVVEDDYPSLEDDIDNIVSETKGSYSKSSLNKMSVDKIKEICKDLDLSTIGNKNLLIERILSQ